VGLIRTLQIVTTNDRMRTAENDHGESLNRKKDKISKQWLYLHVGLKTVLFIANLLKGQLQSL